MTRAMHQKKPRFALAALLAATACGQAEEQRGSVGAASGQRQSGESESATDQAAAKIPAELEKIIGERRAACDGKVGAKFGETLAADFNADGRTDFVLSQENFLCADEPAGQMTWGSAGPQYEFLVSAPVGYLLDEGFSQRFGIAVMKRPAGDVVQFDHDNMSSGGCRGVFTITWSWTGERMELTDRRNKKGQKVDQRGCAASDTVAPGTLPVKPGYYGHAGDGCAVAMRSYTNGISLDNEHWRDIDGDYPLRPIKSLGAGRYKLGQADTIRVTGPRSFIAAEGTQYERRFRWCAEKAPE